MSVSLAAFMGGGRLHSPLSSNLALKAAWASSYRIHTLDPDAAGREVSLPSALLLKLGGPQFILLNIDAALSAAVKDFAGGTVLTLAAMEGVQLYLAGNSAAAGNWIFRRRPL